MTVYRTVKIPEELIESVLSFLEEKNVWGYRSPTEFVIDATRRRLEELQKSRD